MPVRVSIRWQASAPPAPYPPMLATIGCGHNERQLAGGYTECPMGSCRPWGDIGCPDLVAPKRPLGLARRRAVTLDEAMTYALVGLEAA
jgi:hypothetical protein